MHCYDNYFVRTQPWYISNGLMCEIVYITGCFILHRVSLITQVIMSLSFWLFFSCFLKFKAVHEHINLHGYASACMYFHMPFFFSLKLNHVQNVLFTMTLFYRKQSCWCNEARTHIYHWTDDFTRYLLHHCWVIETLLGNYWYKTWVLISKVLVYSYTP